MRIAYYTDTYLPQINGVTNTITRLTGYLDKNKYEYLVLAPEYENERLIEENNIKRFRSIKVPFYPECRCSIPNYSSLKKNIDEFRPDVIHLFTPFGIGFVGLRYAREKNIAVVSSYTTNFDMYLKYYKLDILIEPVWSYFKWFHNYCNINYCSSKYTLNYLKKRGILNTSMFSRGIDTTMFSPEHRDKKIRKTLTKNSKKIVFTYVGRIAAEKDLDILLDSIKIVNIDYIEKVEFIFVGDGPYTRQLKNENLPNIKFMGYLKGKDLSKVYASSDVFVFPSSTETFGNVVLEAMASGLPVITVNKGGVLENVIDKHNGFLCKSRDAKDFARAIKWMINNPEKYKTLSENALKSASNKSWDSIFEKLIIDYKEIITHKKIKSA